MRPSSLAAPVAVTTARPLPRTITVPEKTWDASPPQCFATANDSPVSSDSSTSSPFASTRRASAGTRSPSCSASRSPRTTSRPGMRCSTPSRITSARGLERSRSLSSVRSVRRSWITVIAITTTIDAASTSASVRSPSTR